MFLCLITTPFFFNFKGGPLCCESAKEKAADKQGGEEESGRAHQGAVAVQRGKEALLV